MSQCLSVSLCHVWVTKHPTALALFPSPDALSAWPCPSISPLTPIYCQTSFLLSFPGMRYAPSVPMLHHFHYQHEQHSWNWTENGNPLRSLCPPGMRGRAPVKFPTFLPASFFKSETAAYVISQALDEELQQAWPSELRLVSLDIASHKKAELFYRVYVFSFVLCWREIAFGILWPFWEFCSGVNG